MTSLDRGIKLMIEAFQEELKKDTSRTKSKNYNLMLL